MLKPLSHALEGIKMSRRQYVAIKIPLLILLNMRNKRKQKAKKKIKDFLNSRNDIFKVKGSIFGAKSKHSDFKNLMIYFPM